MTEYPNAPGYMANVYYNDALMYRQEAHLHFRYGERGMGMFAARQALRCWMRFRLWLKRQENAR